MHAGPAGQRRRRGSAPILPRLVTRRPTLGCLFEIVETLVLTLIIFFVIQNFVAQPYKVQQQSMEQTLEPEQYVLVDKLTPRFDTYKRGDIVVFTPPADWVQDDGTPFIKRVIGVGGDTVEIQRRRASTSTGPRSTSRTSYADVPGDPPSRRPSPATRQSVGRPGRRALPDGRPSRRTRPTRGPSGRSRSTHVIGRAWLRYWPLDTFGILPTPDLPGAGRSP